MLEGLVEHLEATHDRGAGEGIRAVLLSGTGEKWCSGVDLKDPRLWVDGSPKIDLFDRLHELMLHSPVPTVCALERYAIAGGAVLAFARDFIIMGRGARLVVNEVTNGHFPR